MAPWIRYNLAKTDINTTCYSDVHVVAQDCLRPANTEDLLPYRDENFQGIPNGNGAQAIITSYQFHCCGDITAWQTFVQPDGGRHNNGQYSINFQVWRPSPTVGNDGAGEYSLVGENRFPNIRFDGSVSETPRPTNVISVRPGDVVGFFLSSSEGGNDGIQLEETSRFRNDRLLWYQTEFPEGPLSTLVAGNGRTLTQSTNAGPMLSVDICKFSYYR